LKKDLYYILLLKSRLFIFPQNSD